METNKEVPTKEKINDYVYNLILSHDREFDSTVDLCTDIENKYLELLKYNLSKQAEVIAEKAKTSMQFNFGVSNDAVSKQSILQASEEYINNLKL